MKTNICSRNISKPVGSPARRRSAPCGGRTFHDPGVTVSRHRSSTTLVRYEVRERAATDRARIEVFNPLVVKALPRDEGGFSPLATDTSAPITWFRQNSPHLQFEAFLHPDRVRRSGQLIMLEPYQAAKVPVIFVHGLLSDPLTWSGLVNELRARDWFNQRYQVWVYGYPTGRPFLRSAADLRHECRAAFEELAGGQPDTPLERAVLVGHSMGGLVSKTADYSQRQHVVGIIRRTTTRFVVDRSANAQLLVRFVFLRAVTVCRASDLHWHTPRWLADCPRIDRPTGIARSFSFP